MRKFFIAHILSLICIVSSAQVGIGTINPSAASMFEIAGSSNNGLSFGGFMPPRVANQIERDQISANSSDTGLLVFVQSSGTFQIWNGIYWETLYTLSTQAVTLAIQDFDTNISWNYTLNPATTYNTNNDIWDIVTSLGSGTTAIDFTSGYYLGCRDLNNTNGGGNFYHEIAFVNVNLSSVVNARMAFDYDVFEFDNGDDVEYEIYHDDVSQGVITLVNGSGNLTVEGTEIINVPNSVTNVRLTLRIIQNGDGDFAGFDNFRVYGE